MRTLQLSYKLLIIIPLLICIEKLLIQISMLRRVDFDKALKAECNGVVIRIEQHRSGGRETRRRCTGTRYPRDGH